MEYMLINRLQLFILMWKPRYVHLAVEPAVVPAPAAPPWAGWVTDHVGEYGGHCYYQYPMKSFSLSKYAEVDTGLSSPWVPVVDLFVSSDHRSIIACYDNILRVYSGLDLSLEWEVDTGAGAGYTPQSIAPADVDGDGLKEAVVPVYDGADTWFKCYDNNGSLLWSTKVAPGACVYPIYMHFADIDGDGFEEVFGIQQYVYVIWSGYVVDHDGSLIATLPVTLPPNSEYFATLGGKLYIADLENSELACYDLLTGSKEYAYSLPSISPNDGVVYAKNLGKLAGYEENYCRRRKLDTGELEVEFTPTNTGLYTLCDTDGDGVEELFIIDDTGAISIWDIEENTETTASVTGLGEFPFRIHSADVDNDGKFEILYSSIPGERIIVIDDNLTVLDDRAEKLGAICDVDLDEFAELITISGSLLRAYRGA